MPRGPKPQPIEVKAQRKPVRSRRVNTRPAPEELALSPTTAPEWLKDEALGIWVRLAPTLSQAKLLSVADRETFGRYCRNFARWLKMQHVLDAAGETYTVTTESGDVHRARPEFVIADRIERQLLAAEDRFGLNPAERQRIFAARSTSGITGDLFERPKEAGRGPDDPAAVPAKPAEALDDPIGSLH